MKRRYAAGFYPGDNSDIPDSSPEITPPDTGPAGDRPVSAENPNREDIDLGTGQSPGHGIVDDYCANEELQLDEKVCCRIQGKGLTVTTYARCGGYPSLSQHDMHGRSDVQGHTWLNLTGIRDLPVSIQDRFDS